MNKKELGKIIHERRTKIGKTQKETAEYLGTSEQAYQKYEYGTNEPSAIKLIKIAEYFNVSIDYLVGRTDNPEVNR